MTKKKKLWEDERRLHSRKRKELEKTLTREGHGIFKELEKKKNTMMGIVDKEDKDRK